MQNRGGGERCDRYRLVTTERMNELPISHVCAGTRLSESSTNCVASGTEEAGGVHLVPCDSKMKKKYIVSPPHKPPPKHLARKTLLSYGNGNRKSTVVDTGGMSKRQENSNSMNQDDSKINYKIQKDTNFESKMEIPCTEVVCKKSEGRRSDKATEHKVTRSRVGSLNTAFLKKLNCTDVKNNNNELILKTARTDPLLNILTKLDKRVESENDILSASEHGNIAGVMSILVKGFHPDACIGLNGYRPLHYAVSRGHINIAERLLFFGAGIDVQTKDGESPLMLASYKGYHNIVEMLIDKGADVNQRNNFGETALFYASRRGFPTVVRLLLERNADSQIQSKFKDIARDDCLNERTKLAFDDIKTILPTTGGPAKCLVGRLLLNVLSFLDATSLCRAAQVNGRWHGKANQKDLWECLGLSRWEMAMRNSLPEEASGFTMAPFMSSYRPSSSRSTKSNTSYSSDSSRSNSRPTSRNGDKKQSMKKNDADSVSASNAKVRTVPGFSAEFLFD